MGKIIAVVSGKGGTGKTSFTACVSLALAAMGHTTLALDCDITLRNLDLALGLSDSAAMDFSDVLEGRCTLTEAAVPHRKYPKLSLLAAAVVEGQETVDAQAGGFADLKAGGGGGAKGVLGQNAAVSGAELDHQFLFVVVSDQCDIHGGTSFHKIRSASAAHAGR